MRYLLASIFSCIILIITIDFLLFVKIGHYRNYEYHDCLYPTPYGRIESRLIGEDRLIKSGDSIRTSPYKLMLWISLSPDILPNKNDLVIIESLVLYNSNNGAVVLSKLGMDSGFNKNGGKEYSSKIFLFEGLSLDYVDYDLDIVLSIKGFSSLNVTNKHVHCKINRDYQEGDIFLANQ